MLTAILHRRHWKAGGSRPPLLIVRLSARLRRSAISRNERGLRSSALCSDEDTPEIFTKVCMQRCPCINESTSVVHRVRLPYFRFKVIPAPCTVRRCIVHGRESKLCDVSPQTVNRYEEVKDPECHAEAHIHGSRLPFSKISAENFDH